MKLARRRFFLEQLEERCCPALTAQVVSGTLVVSGLPTGNVLLTETAPNVFQVKDGSTTLGPYSATNVSLNLTNHQGKSVNVNLNGNTLAGNLNINEGTGDTSSLVDFSTGVFGGRIGGSLTVTGGSGFETLIPGFQVAPGTPIVSTLSVGGDLTFNAVANTAPFAFNVLDTGVLFPAPPTVTVDGNINTTAVDNLGISVNTKVGKSVSMQAAGEQAFPNVIVAGTVARDVTVTGGNGGTAANLIGAKVGGNLNFTLGAGANTFDLDAASTVSGNATVTGGAGSDSVTLEGTVGGSLSVDLGDGANSATVQNAPGGVLNWTSGRGGAHLTLGDAGTRAGSTWNVNVQFGAGDDTFTLSGPASNGAATPAPQFLAGRVDPGGHVLGDVFQEDLNVWTIAPHITVNDGSAQRSMVTSLTLTYPGQPTSLPSFEVDRVGGGAVGLHVASAVVDGETVVTLTFTGPGVVGGSLPDGVYTLKVNGSAVAVTHFFRLFGDSNGDGQVDATDLNAFAAAARSRKGMTNYRSFLDYDQDGVIGALDYAQFLKRYKTRLNPDGTTSPLP